jgi:HSP20 family molecular chaperone IbpA
MRKKDIDVANAAATFQDGVLRIIMPLPPRQEHHGRRIEVQGTENQPSQR